jgi:plasmid stability protein
MAILLVRGVDEALVRRLKERAAEHGRSAEAEHRHILEEALRSKRTDRDLWESLWRGVKTEIDFGEGIDQTIRPADFD